MKPLTIYSNGREYMAVIEYSKAIDVKAHFKQCPEYGFKNINRFRNLMRQGELWRWKEEVKEQGFEIVAFDKVVNDLFPNGYTWATFTKFLFIAFGADAFINVLTSAIVLNEANPNPADVMRQLKDVL